MISLFDVTCCGRALGRSRRLCVYVMGFADVVRVVDD
jgi:hypothetical protein